MNIIICKIQASLYFSSVGHRRTGGEWDGDRDGYMPCSMLYCAVLTSPPGGHTQVPPPSCCSVAIQEPGSPGCHTALRCHNTWLLHTHFLFHKSTHTHSLQISCCILASYKQFSDYSKAIVIRRGLSANVCYLPSGLEIYYKQIKLITCLATPQSSLQRDPKYLCTLKSSTH